MSDHQDSLNPQAAIELSNLESLLEHPGFQHFGAWMAARARRRLSELSTCDESALSPARARWSEAMGIANYVEEQIAALKNQRGDPPKDA